MTSADFSTNRFSLFTEQTLADWVLRGIHLPRVKVYRDEHSGAYYQVCEQARLYRHTDGSSETEALPYGKWKELG
jgi:hypothetical protein